VTRLAPGDPASLSSLAADLHRCADVLRDRRSALSRAEEALIEWRGAAGEAFRSAFRTQLRVLDDTAEALTTCAHALQEYSVDLQYARSLSVEAEDYCHRHGLELSDDATVRMPWGAYSVEEADAYAARVPEGQRLASRAREEAEDGARRLARRVDAPVHALAAARHAVLAAVQLAAQAASPTYR
jgi:uncharacterized protein YukE